MPATETSRQGAPLTDRKTGLTPVDLAFAVLTQPPGLMISDIHLAQAAQGEDIYPDEASDWLRNNIYFVRSRAAERGLTLYACSSAASTDHLYYTLQPPQSRGALIYDQNLARSIRDTAPPAYHQPLLDVNAAQIINHYQAIFRFTQNPRHLVDYLAGRLGRTSPMKDIFPYSTQRSRLGIVHTTNQSLAAAGNPLRIYLINMTSNLMLLLNPQGEKVDIPYPFPGLDDLPPAVRNKIRRLVRLKSSGPTNLDCDLTAGQLHILAALIQKPHAYHPPAELGLTDYSYKQQIALMRQILGDDFFRTAPGGYTAHGLSNPESRSAKFLDAELRRLIDLPENSALGAIPLEILRILNFHLSQPFNDEQLLSTLETRLGKEVHPETLKQHINSLRPYLRPPFAIYRDLYLGGYLLHDTREPLSAANLLAARLPDYQRLPPPLISFLLWAHAPVRLSPKGIVNRFYPNSLLVLEALVRHSGQTLTHKQLGDHLSRIHPRATRESIHDKVKDAICHLKAEISTGPFRNKIFITNEREVGYCLEFA